MVGAPAPISYVLPFPPLFPSFCPSPPPDTPGSSQTTGSPVAGHYKGNAMGSSKPIFKK